MANSAFILAFEKPKVQDLLAGLWSVSAGRRVEELCFLTDSFKSPPTFLRSALSAILVGTSVMW